MKKRLTALAMALAMVMGTVALAAGTEKTISVNPMELTVNGQTVTPQKSDGTPAEVFAYDGATYVPLRYLSELLGIQVDWEAESAGVAKLVDVPGFTAPAGGYKAGTYTASADGRNGKVNVAVTFSDSAITKIEITGHAETAGISDAAF